MIYHVEIKNSNGDIKNQWLDADDIKFIDPDFLDRMEAGSSGKSTDLEHKANDFKCKECKITFKRSENLKQHVSKKHSDNNEKYKCPECTSVFKYRSNWTQHMTRTHQWERQDAHMEIENARILKTRDFKRMLDFLLLSDLIY